MLEKIKSLPLTNVIIIGLLCYILFSGMFQSTSIVKTDTSFYENKIKDISKQLKIIEEQNNKSSKKIDSLQIAAKKSTTKINYLIQTQLKDDKSTLNKMSDDENVIYFHNYINAYKASSSNGK